MAEKTLSSRIIHKHDTAANWLKTNFIPKQGEIIVYDIDADYNYERIKIGDGKTGINSLPFVDEALKDYVDTEVAALSDDISAIDALVGDTSVSSQITNAIANKADASHTHDDRYYTESEVDTKLSTKANADHTHDIGSASVSHATTADTANAVAWANVTDKPNTYTPADHSHDISDVANLQIALDSKVPGTRTVNGKALSADITLSASDVGADVSGAADTALTNANDYTDAQIAAMVGDNTVAKQISDAISEVEGQIVEPTFYVTFTRQADDTYVADKTYAAVEDAYVAGQTVMGLLNLGLEMLYHIPVLYCVQGFAIAFHTNIESSDPITVAYGADGTVVVQTYAKIASKTDVSDAIAAIDYPVDSVNGKTGAVILSASDVGADVSGSASAALTNAKAYTDSAISAIPTPDVSGQIETHNTSTTAHSDIRTSISDLNTLVGDTAVSTQISNAVSEKADVAAGVYVVTAASSDGIAYTATVPGIEALESGVSFIMIPGVRSQSNSPTVNVNGLGAMPIRRRLSNLATALQNGYTATWLAENKPFTLVYDGTAWVVEGLTRPVTADLYGTVSVEKGGTGATEPIEARENLLMIVSATEPTSPETGMLWFDIS